ncbi:MAG: hypothetical protein J6T72_01485 [Alphaproteobacteria bacterium]|nr:hypothetical protein [Alphaproteobacteria bacterium]
MKNDKQKRAQIAEKVKKIVADTYELPDDCIKEDDRFLHVLGSSSEAVQVITNLENSFNCKLPVIKEKTTVGSIISRIHSLL